MLLIQFFSLYFAPSVSSKKMLIYDLYGYPYLCLSPKTSHLITTTKTLHKLRHSLYLCEYQ